VAKARGALTHRIQKKVSLLGDGESSSPRRRASKLFSFCLRCSLTSNGSIHAPCDDICRWAIITRSLRIFQHEYMTHVAPMLRQIISITPSSHPHHCTGVEYLLPQPVALMNRSELQMPSTLMPHWILDPACPIIRHAPYDARSYWRVN
jgi:hypothetical protein